MQRDTQAMRAVLPGLAIPYRVLRVLPYRVARPAIAVSMFADSAIAIITEKTPTTVGVFNGNPFAAGTSF